MANNNSASGLRVGLIGNFGPAHSTETHLRQAWQAAGADVVAWQENDVDWATHADTVSDSGVGFVQWTTTHDYAPPATYPAQRTFLDACPVPVVSYHLDRWWGLDREHRVRDAPFFRTDLVVTADGGHDEQWAAAGVNHRWLPPGVSEFECVPGVRRAEYASPVVFVGSHQGGYHREWRHRDQLVRFLRSNYRRRCVFWPKPGEHAVRGEPLRDLYASATVVVGDSCLAGNATRYWSDRIPETLGRGGFLLHPWVQGLDDHFDDGKHLVTWPAGDWRRLRTLIDHYLAHPDEAHAIGQAGRAHVLAHHTYTTRVGQVVDLLRGEGLLP